jgi:glycosyltransferase involved in cell wall biosynthesis
MMDISVVVPIYNERENLERLHEEIVAAMDGLGPGYSYEVIYVDDGSEDGSREVLRRIHAGDDRVQVVLLRKNFGQTAAMSAGFRRAAGSIIVTLDGDLQNDPADIPALLDKLDEGFDLVTGWRRDRKDGFLRRRLPSLVANWIIRRATRVKVHDYGCMLKAYRAEIAKGLRLYGEMHRFIPAIADDMGAVIAEIEVNHRPRRYGDSKYGLGRTVRVVLDLITVKFLSAFATRPIQVFGLLGLCVGVAGGGLLAWLAIEKLFLGVELGGRPIVLLGILLSVTSVQLVTLGLLGEMLARTYHESQDKPVYVVAEVLEARSGDASGRVRGPGPIVAGLGGR